ncbi:hypothetical protein MA16_Dca026578 [Dendrobium catenatum]|uniref:Uncharacterized protein n=1 Tax=Dendrobium catenatum TaxID=906689 RepID=A0A2I0VX98_9ASPA|nr:hypothetical protein MA16_Dca026578 [Dendrobium catenatum]
MTDELTAEKDVGNCPISSGLRLVAQFLRSGFALAVRLHSFDDVFLLFNFAPSTMFTVRLRSFNDVSFLFNFAPSTTFPSSYSASLACCEGSYSILLIGSGNESSLVAKAIFSPSRVFVRVRSFVNVPFLAGGRYNLSPYLQGKNEASNSVAEVPKWITYLARSLIRSSPDGSLPIFDP